MNVTRRRSLFAACAALGTPFISRAQTRQLPGVSQDEIRVGSTMPFSGPLSGMSTVGKISQAYFTDLNARGGLRGRRVNLIQRDDGYNPGKALELTRSLVEQTDVSFIYQTLGTASNNAIHRYLSAKSIPQLLIFSGATKWVDPKQAPYVLPGTTTYGAEAGVYARWILQNKPSARIAILLQNDDYGKDYVDGLKLALGERAQSMVIAQATYEVTDSSVDSQVASLKASNADIFLVFSTGKFSVQALRRAHDIGWKPQIILPVGSSSLDATLRPAGAEKVVGAITASIFKASSDSRWTLDPALSRLKDLVRAHMPNYDPSDPLITAGYVSAQLLEEILKRCGDDLSRENIMTQALSLRRFSIPMMLPEVSISASATNRELYEKVWLQRFDGKNWVVFGAPVSVS